MLMSSEHALYSSLVVLRPSTSSPLFHLELLHYDLWLIFSVFFLIWRIFIDCYTIMNEFLSWYVITQNNLYENQKGSLNLVDTKIPVHNT